jgi:hypothetical protein
MNFDKLLNRVFFIYAALICVLLAGCASPVLTDGHHAGAGSSDSIRPRLPADVAMNRDAGHGNEIFVTIRLESGEELPFVLDTGTTWTVFDKSLEPKLGRRVHTATVWRWGVKEELGIYVAPKLYLGGARLMTDTTVVTDDFKQISSQVGHPIMGLLGMDVLANYCIQLDFEAGKIRFLDGGHANKKKWGRAFPLTDIGDGCMAISGNLAGVKGAGSVIDTGCDYDGWLTSPVFQQWTNQMQSPADGEARRPNGVLGGETYRHIDEMHGLGAESLADGDTHMKLNGLGLHFLSRCVVTFDFPNRTMYLKRPGVWSLIF